METFTRDAQHLDHYGLTAGLTPKGDRLLGCCPIHRGHNKTQFHVDLKKNCWRCFGDCNEGGNILDFVQRMEGAGNIRDAALMIQEWFLAGNEASKPKREKSTASDRRQNMPRTERGSGQRELVREEKQMEPAVNVPLKFTLTNLDPRHPYLKERGLSDETITEFGLGFCQKGIMAGRIAIPVHDEIGRLLAYIGRWPGMLPNDNEPRYKLPPGFHKSLVLFNLHRGDPLSGENSLVVVEGVFDCIELWQAGVHNVVALLGSSLSPAQEDFLVSARRPNGPVILLLDGDEAGRAGAGQALERLARRVPVRIIELSEGTQPEGLSEGDLLELLPQCFTEEPAD